MSLVLFNCLALVSLVYINTGFILVAGQTAKDKGHSMSVFNTYMFFSLKFYIHPIYSLIVHGTCMYMYILTSAHSTFKID